MSNEYRDVAGKAGTSAEAVAVAPVPAKPSLWILGSWQDLLLFVGTPLVILPLFFLLRTRMSVDDIALYVLAFGALGHHLPGMMRAYGDKALFRRFRVRFILAPLFLGAVCMAFSLWELSAITLAVYLWGAWHGLMQTYGFVRIYDAKKRSFAKITTRLDFYMCFCWIITGVLWSPPRVFFLLELYHVQCGAPLPPAAVVSGIQIAAAVVTGLVTIAFLLNHVRLMRIGQSPSPIKLLLLATSIGFWWYANFAFSNMLVGVALFEIFHDVQYLSIVWVFNRGRVEKDPSVGGFTRFVFRRSGALIGIYVGMVFAYGSLNLWTKGIADETIRGALTGLLAGSALLHFYYDGFIWKFREKKTSEALDLGGADEQQKRGFEMPPWLIHGAKWSLFVIPLALLGFTQPRERDPGDNFRRLRDLVETIPGNPHVHKEYADVLKDSPESDKAIEHYRLALDNGIKLGSVHHNLGELLARQGQRDDAMAEYRRALEIEPKSAATHTNMGLILVREGKLEAAIERYDQALAIEEIAGTLVNRGIALMRLERNADAEIDYRRAIELDAGLALAHESYGALLAAQGRLDEAVAAYTEAQRLNPALARVSWQLGRVFVARDDPGAAERHFREAIRLNPNLGRAHQALGRLLIDSGATDDARRHLETAKKINPKLPGIDEDLGRLPPVE